MEESRPVRLNRDGVRGMVLWYVMILVNVPVLLLSAGNLWWWRAWVFIGLSMGYQTITNIVLVKVDPALLNERGRMHADETASHDKVFVVLFLPLILGSMVVCGLDAERFGWSVMPFWLFFLGAGLTVPGYLLGVTAMTANPHFELTARIQADRGHSVIQSGPYRYIRHPGYAGEILSLLGTPLILGSWWGFIPIGALILTFVIRTALEDKVLKAELSGYDRYAEIVRYRLVPYIW